MKNMSAVGKEWKDKYRGWIEKSPERQREKKKEQKNTNGVRERSSKRGTRDKDRVGVIKAGGKERKR